MTRFSTLRQLAGDIGDRDPGELFEGDEDPTEVQRPTVATWHASYKPAQPVSLDIHPTDKGREVLRQALAMCAPAAKRTAVSAPSRRSSWYATPIGLRRLLAKAAGLEAATAEKMDIQLTESEKAALRGAALRLKLVVEPLTEI